MAHFVVMQYDPTVRGTCRLYGDEGRGVLDAPRWAQYAVGAAIGLSVLLTAVLVLSFTFDSFGAASAHVSLAASALEDPLRLLYYLRNSLPRLIPRAIPISGDRGAHSLRQHLQDERVRMGESKDRRGEPVGTLVLDAPSNVIRLRGGRRYE
ncbi:hypothetical protein DFJ73DRAFT_853016 [Zopfochytrium polystomum]|nr:hypothetical protein DFJ73DRAFT_853016 [Zopfochytrium polystomum]